MPHPDLKPIEAYDICRFIDVVGGDDWEFRDFVAEKVISDDDSRGVYVDRDYLEELFSEGYYMQGYVNGKWTSQLVPFEDTEMVYLNETIEFLDTYFPDGIVLID